MSAGVRKTAEVKRTSVVKAFMEMDVSDMTCVTLIQATVAQVSGEAVKVGLLERAATLRRFTQAL